MPGSVRVDVMTDLTMKTAIQLTGASERTIRRHIAKGTLSATKNGAGANVFDASELQRVFGDLKMPVTDDTPDGGSVMPGSVTSNLSPPDSALQVEKAYLERERDQLTERVDKLEQQLDHERDARETERSRHDETMLRKDAQISAMITDQREKHHVEQTKAEVEAKRPRTLWQWLGFGAGIVLLAGIGLFQSGVLDIPIYTF